MQVALFVCNQNVVQSHLYHVAGEWRLWFVFKAGCHFCRLFQSVLCMEGLIVHGKKCFNGQCDGSFTLPKQTVFFKDMNDNPCVIFFCASSSQEIYHPPSLTLLFEIPLRTHQNSLICACKSPLHSGNPYFPFLSNVERSLIPRKMLNLLYPWLLLLELRIS